MDFQVPQIILNCLFWRLYQPLAALQDDRIPVPTPADVIVAIAHLSAALVASPWDNDLKAAALLFQHKVLASNCDHTFPIPRAHEAITEGGAAAGGGKEVVVAKGEGGADGWLEVQPAQGGVVDSHDGMTAALRGLAQQMQGMERRLAERIDRLDQRLNARVDRLETRWEDERMQREDREMNSLRWEAGLDLEPVRVGDRAFPAGLIDPNACRIRHGADVRRMVHRDLDSWLEFYDIDIGPEAKHTQKEMVLVKYLGGAETRLFI